MTATENVSDLYSSLIESWNDRDAEAMSALFAPHGTMIGFDGSLSTGPGAIRDHLSPIFADHPTAAYVTIVRGTHDIGGDTILLLADAGMVPPGRSEIHADANARQTLVASRSGVGWAIDLFQNTPTALHWDDAGRNALTAELESVLTRRENGPSGT